jgi:hypothetical protein
LRSRYRRARSRGGLPYPCEGGRGPDRTVRKRGARRGALPPLPKVSRPGGMSSPHRPRKGVRRRLQRDPGRGCVRRTQGGQPLVPPRGDGGPRAGRPAPRRTGDPDPAAAPSEEWRRALHRGALEAQICSYGALRLAPPGRPDWGPVLDAPRDPRRYWPVPPAGYARHGLSLPKSLPAPHRTQGAP